MALEKKSLDHQNGIQNHSNGESLKGDGIVLNAKALELTSGPRITGDESRGEKQPAQSSSAQPPLRLTVLGFLLGVVGSLLVATGTSCAQALQGSVPDFELASLRGVFQWFLASCVLLASRTVPRLRRPSVAWVTMMGLFSAAFNITNYLSVNYIAVGIASCIRRTISLVYVTIMARLILKELITVIKIISVAISMVGVILLIQPWYEQTTTTTSTVQTPVFLNPICNFLTKNFPYFHPAVARMCSSHSDLDTTWPVTFFNTSGFTTMEPDGGGPLTDDVIGYLLAFTAGICATSGVLVQKSRLQEYTPVILNFYAGFIVTIIPLVISLITEDWTFPSEAGDIALVLGQSLCSGIAIIILTNAVHLASPVVVTLAMSLQVVFLFIAQYTVLADIQPTIGNWVEIFGAVLVVLAAVLTPIWTVAQAKLRAPTKEDLNEKNTSDVIITHL